MQQGRLEARGARDKYIKFENAGDQFLGRTLAGLDSLSKNFSISPCFFHLTQAEMSAIDQLLHDNVVGAATCTSKTFEVLRICFAALVYHRDLMDENLQKKHLIRSHPLFNNLPEVRYE